MSNIAVFSGSNSLDLTAKICEYLNIEIGRAETQPFPNGESMVKINTNVRSKDVFIVQSVCRTRIPTPDNPHTGVNDNLMELFLWIDALVRSSAHRVTAVIPFFGYARQDRKTEGRTPISSKVVAACLEELGCDRVLTLDLHSEAIQGFFSHRTILDHLNATNIFADYFKQLDLHNAVVLSPDVGNLKKADKYRQKMPSHYELAVIDKRRTNGSVESKRIIGDVHGKTVILFDDIISTAGTMRSAIDLALTYGAKDFYLAATHGEFVGGSVQKLKHDRIKEICITDSIPPLPLTNQQLPVKILSIAKLLGEGIRRVHNGNSISEML